MYDYDLAALICKAMSRAIAAATPTDALAMQTELDEALVTASDAGDANAVRILIAGGASHAHTRPSGRGLSQGEWLTGGRAPLAFAAAKGSLETVQVLLEEGADRAAADASGLTAFDLACRGVCRHAGDKKRAGIAELLRPNETTDELVESHQGGDSVRELELMELNFSREQGPRDHASRLRERAQLLQAELGHVPRGLASNLSETERIREVIVAPAMACSWVSGSATPSISPPATCRPVTSPRHSAACSRSISPESQVVRVARTALEGPGTLPDGRSTLDRDAGLPGAGRKRRVKGGEAHAAKPGQVPVAVHGRARHVTHPRHWALERRECCAPHGGDQQVRRVGFARRWVS